MKKPIILLIRLGYEVDSSITPGLNGEIIIKLLIIQKRSNDILIYKSNEQKLISIPISIQRKIKKFDYLYNIYQNKNISNNLMNKLFNKFFGYEWFRPAYNNNYNLISYLEKYDQEYYVLTMHSNELTINTSPYISDKLSNSILIHLRIYLFILLNKIINHLDSKTLENSTIMIE